MIEAAGLLKDGFSFQTGAGGTSLAVADAVKRKMLEQQIKGSFGCGGITGYFVDMLEEGFFRTLFDVQCFDLRAVESIGRNIMHREISADLYANPFNRGSVVNLLDCVILGATEVDVNFNVNVNTESNGLLLHNTGGHCDTAAGAKLAIVVAPSIRGRLADRPRRGDHDHDAGRDGRRGGDRAGHRGGRPARGPQEGAARGAACRSRRSAQLHEEICALTGTPRPIEFDRRGRRADRVPRRVDHRRGATGAAVGQASRLSRRRGPSHT